MMGEGIAQVVEHMISRHEVLGSISSPSSKHKINKPNYLPPTKNWVMMRGITVRLYSDRNTPVEEEN